MEVRMFKKLFKKESRVLYTPITGKVIPLDEVPDAVFSGKMVGDGFAVIPAEGKVYAPVNGKIVQFFPTKHALGIIDENGLEVLIHFGIDTVELKGQGFTAHKAVGDRVQIGDLLLEVDLQVLEAHDKSPITPIVLTNKTQYKSLSVKFGDYKANQQVCTVE